MVFSIYIMPFASSPAFLPFSGPAFFAFHAFPERAFLFARQGDPRLIPLPLMPTATIVQGARMRVQINIPSR